jgi:hypothetical protein
LAVKEEKKRVGSAGKKTSAEVVESEVKVES